MPLQNAAYELSPQQKQFFAAGQESACAGLGILLEGTVDAEKIRDCLQTIVQRHEILRTTFQRRTGMKFPFQVINEAAAFGWEQADLSALGKGEQDERIEEYLTGHSKIDFEHGPVVYVRLLNLGDERNVLVINVSALCVDDHSLSRIFIEFTQLYSGQKLADDILQYADFSEWQNEFLSSDDAEAREAAGFWKESGADSLPPISLPFGLKFADAQASWGSAPVDLQPNSSPDLEQFLLAAWVIFLSRMSGRQEFVLGYAGSGRNHEEFSEGIGLFTRTLPLRINLEADPSFRSLQRQTQKLHAAALDWEDYFSADRLGNGAPFGFSFTQIPGKAEAGGVLASELARLVPIPGMHIQLRCTKKVESLAVSLVYDRSHFEPDVIIGLAERFAILLKSAQSDPESIASALPILSQTERQKVLVEFNETAADYPHNKCIHQLFEEQVASHPNRPALRFVEREFSYADLNRDANRIAHVLLEYGIGRNVPVALCLERSAEMIVALLGILKSGGCYVPLVPDNPKSRLAHQLAETATPVILTEQKFLNNLPESGARVVCLDRDQDLLAKASDSDPRITVSPEDLVYVIYTSGSTGTPKGVAVRHYNLVNYSNFICKRLKLEGRPSGLHFATVSTISADLGNTCIFPSLISGGCLHVIGYETAMSPALFSAYMAQHSVDVLKITPSHLSSLLNIEDPVSVLPKKYLILGGEAARWDLVQRIRGLNRCALLNHYGPTEATVGCCTFSPDEFDVSAWQPATMPIGKPIDNDAIYILDRHAQPPPVGVAGELCIGGTGLAKGYLNQPEQTAERFVPNPFSSKTEARIYRTGDLARFLPDGNIEFLGRIDAQVKIRGFRVEPAEIESVLKRHPDVKHAVVLPYEDKSGEKRLAAYVIPRPKLGVDSLREFAKAELPDYMVPASFVLMDSLPLTPNGKLDTRALPSPEQKTPERAFVPPQNPEEEKLARIWREVLRLDRVGVTDNFFELGGHSLLATQIISRLRNGFRIQMPLQVFLQNPTIAGLASQLGNFPVIESEQEEMARLLKDLEGISDEEAERILAAELQKDEER